jgi:hypothetical protein
MLAGVVIDDTGLFNTSPEGVRGLLQLPSTARSSRGPDAV